MSAKKTSRKTAATTPSAKKAKAAGRTQAAGASRGTSGSGGAGVPTAARPAAKRSQARVAGTGAARAAKGSKGKAVAHPPAAQKPAKARKLSGLDAAAQVLARAARPMNATEVMAEIQAKCLWATKGATPKATIYAAIIREIAAKGKASRFKKTDRGTFTAKAV